MAILRGPAVPKGGLIFAVDPGSERGSYMQDIVSGQTATTSGTPDSSTEAYKTVSFDANGEYYHYGTSNVVRGLGNLTMMGWVKQPATSNPHQTLFCTSMSYRYGLKLMSRYHGQWSVWIGTSGTSDHLCGSGHTIAGDDIFYLIGCTRDSSSGDILLYEDGALEASHTNVSITGTITESGNTAYGSEYHSAGYYHTGKLGHVWVWNRKLSAAEIADVYNATKSRYK